MTTAFVPLSAMEMMVEEMRLRRWRETGGVVFGYIVAGVECQLVVTQVTGPGSRARHGFRTFAPDGAYCQAALEKVYRESGAVVSYLGDWHSHAVGSTRPSLRDVATMRDVAEDEEYRITIPLLLISRFSLIRRGFHLAAYVFDSNEGVLGRLDNVEIEVCEEPSQTMVTSTNHP